MKGREIMIKRYILGIVFVLLIIGAGVGIAASWFYGNPLTDMQNKRTVRKFLNEAGIKDIEQISSDYNYKTGIYEYHIVAAGEDSKFQIEVKDGKIPEDMNSGEFIQKTLTENTWERLSGEYLREAEEAMSKNMESQNFKNLSLKITPSPEEDGDVKNGILKLAGTQYSRRSFETLSDNLTLNVEVRHNRGSWDDIFEAVKTVCDSLKEKNLKPPHITVEIRKEAEDEPLIGVYDMDPEIAGEEDFNSVIDDYIR